MKPSGLLVKSCWSWWRIADLNLAKDNIIGVCPQLEKMVLLWVFWMQHTKSPYVKRHLTFKCIQVYNKKIVSRQKVKCLKIWIVGQILNQLKKWGYAYFDCNTQKVQLHPIYRTLTAIWRLRVFQLLYLKVHDKKVSESKHLHRRSRELLRTIFRSKLISIKYQNIILNIL